MTGADEKARRKRLTEAFRRAEQASSAALMPLERAQLEELLDHVHAAVAADGCDSTWAGTDAWARGEGVDLEHLHRGLAEYGGFCDCEVVMNVHPEEVWPTRFR